MLYPPSLLAIHPGEGCSTTNFLEGHFSFPIPSRGCHSPENRSWEGDLLPAFGGGTVVKHCSVSISDVGLYLPSPDPKIAVRGAVPFNRRLTERNSRIILGFQRKEFPGARTS